MKRRLSFTHLHVVLLTIAVGLAIPVVLYLIVTGRSAGMGDAAVGTRQAADDLARLAREQALARDRVAAKAGEEEVLAASGVRKEAGSLRADAESIRVSLAGLAAASRVDGDDAVTQFFAGLPPGTEKVETKRLSVQVGEAWGRPVMLAELPGRIYREQGGLAIAAVGTAGAGKCLLEVVRSGNSGRLSVLYECPAGPLLASPALPAGAGFTADRFALTSGTAVEIENLRVVGREGGKARLQVGHVSLTADHPVDADAFASALSPLRLRSAGAWKMVLEGVAGDPAYLAGPGIVAFPPGAGGISFLADKVEADAEGTARVEGVKAEGEGWKVEARTAVQSREGDKVRWALSSARGAVEAFALELSADGAVVESGVLRTVAVRLERFQLGLSSNPLATARLVKWGLDVKAGLQALGSGGGNLRPLALPEGFPDFKVEAVDGEVALPLLAVEPVGGVSVTAAGSGGMLERLSVRACRPAKTCERLRVEAGVETDSAGQVEAARLAVGGTMAGEALAGRFPGLVQGVKEVDAGCELRIPAVDPKPRLKCSLRVAGLTLFHKMLAEVPFTFPSVEVEGEAVLDRQAGTVDATLSKIRVGEASFRAVAHAERLSPRPVLKVALDFPEQDCGMLLRSVPEGFAPRLAEARLYGPLWFSVDVEADLADLRKLLRIDVEGDWDGCQAETLGSDFDVERLNRPDFVHRVVVNGEDLGVEVGPGTAGYVPLSQIPPVLQAAMMGTEDLAFYSHRGFKVSLIRRALVLLAERGRYVYGGSTISQQLVKNLFLSREKTLARKFEEALIVWQMERKVPKERILELYINCIEYGPKVWGITAAAQTYFGKPPSQLSTLEAAFLAGLKPDPAYGYLQYTRGKLNKHWRKFLDHVLDRLLEMKSISQEEHDRCLKQELAFAASGAPLVALPPVGPGEDDRPVKQGQEQEEL